MLRIIYRILFAAFGWKINGNFPHHLPKYIIAVAPHTSNWDFIVGLAGRSVMKLERIKFLGKSQLFKPPFGWFFRYLGGYPVDRTSKHDMVNQVVDMFHSHDEFILAIAPEGTRKKVSKIKTGFYYIAKKANVPIVPCGFDFSKKQIVVGQPLFPSDDFSADLQQLYSFHSSIQGKFPELGISTEDFTPESVT
jgi:1-acyl-sn-glycerol-3-phosphate acyltransferase